MTSLYRQLALWLTGTLLVMGVVHLWLVRSFPRYLTEEYVLTRLQHDADVLLSRLEVSADGQLTLPTEALAPIYESPYSGHYFTVTFGTTTLKSRSLLDYTLAVMPAKTAQRRVERIPGPRDEPMLVWVAGVEMHGLVGTLAVAEDVAHMEGDIAEMQRRYLTALALAAAVLIAMQTAILRRVLKPIEAARTELNEIFQGQRERIDLRVPDEFQPFVDELNRLIQWQRQRLERSRKATGNLAHALKTPLSLLNQILESTAIQGAPSVRRDLEATLCRLRSLVDTELRRARLAGSAAPGQTLLIGPEIRDLGWVLERLYQEKGINCEILAPSGLCFPADREDVLELFGNLLDNACKWAKSRVRVQIGPGPDLTALIEDDGPGVSPEELHRLTVRGQRLDESTPGHGLGLSIVEDIVAQYAGKLHFSRSEALGGMACFLTLPAARARDGRCSA